MYWSLTLFLVHQSSDGFTANSSAFPSEREASQNVAHCCSLFESRCVYFVFGDNIVVEPGLVSFPTSEEQCSSTSSVVRHPVITVRVCYGGTKPVHSAP